MQSYRHHIINEDEQGSIQLPEHRHLSVVPPGLQLLLHNVISLPCVLCHNYQCGLNVPDILRCLKCHTGMANQSLCCPLSCMLHSFYAANQGLNHSENLCVQSMGPCCINCATRNGYSWFERFGILRNGKYQKENPSWCRPYARSRINSISPAFLLFPVPGNRDCNWKSKRWELFQNAHQQIQYGR